MAAAAAQQPPANCTYTPMAENFGMSAGQCAPIRGAQVPNPQAFYRPPENPMNVPLGMGLPSRLPASTPSSAPIAADIAKAQYGGGGVSAHEAAAPEVKPVADGYGQMLAQPPPQAVDPRALLVPIDHHRLMQVLGPLSNRVKTRRYVAPFDFSAFEAAQNPQAVLQRVKDQTIFQHRQLDPLGKMRRGHLDTGIIVGVRVIEVKNDCDLPIAVQISGVRGNTYSFSGKRAPLVMAPNVERTYGKRGLVVHSLTDKIDVVNLERYSHLTPEKLKEGIMTMNGEKDIAFVEMNHPVMDVIRANQDHLKVDVNSFGKLKGKYYVVTSNVVRSCLDLFNSEFFQRNPFTALGDFSIKLERLDGRPWDSPEGIAHYFAGSDRVVAESLGRRNHVFLWLEIDYLVHAQPAATPPASYVVDPTAAAAAQAPTNGF